MHLNFWILVTIAIIIDGYGIYGTKNADSDTLLLIRNIMYQLVGVQVLTIGMIILNQVFNVVIINPQINQLITKYLSKDYAFITSLIVFGIIFVISILQIKIVDRINK